MRGVDYGKKKKFEDSDCYGRDLAKRDLYNLPNVGWIIDSGLQDRIDLKVESGSTYVPVEVKYRPNDPSTRYKDGRIQKDTKYQAILKAKGFLYMRFNDGIWFLWDLNKTKPCDDGEWTHSEHSVLNDGDITDNYVAFDYKDALYTNAK